MTTGLLISRDNKIRLHKISLSNPNSHNITTYKIYCNSYNTVLGCSKQNYFEFTVKIHSKNR
jgi:hypothetical protein